MQRLKPQFDGPSAYFTAWDKRIISRTDNSEALRIAAERKLKVLLLVKSSVTCAASHLNSPLVYSILKKHPILLKESLIIPALRSDKQGIADIFDRSNVSREMIAFYSDNVKKVVDWELTTNSNWFQGRFVKELKSPNSVIRLQLSKLIPKKKITEIVSHVKGQKILGRDAIDAVIRDFPESAQQLMLNFRELLYHISGARVVGCESCLPQENYIDYDLADLTQKRTKLSEENILLKLFFEQAFQALQKQPIPVELLDMLTFDDIFSIRKPLLEASFQEKYNRLLNFAIDSFSANQDGIVLNIEELCSIHGSIMETFKQIFNHELIPLAKRLRYESGKLLISPALSVALGVAGTVSVIAPFAGLLSLMKDSDSLGSTAATASFCNVLNLSDTSRAHTFLIEREKVKVAQLRWQIEHTELLNKSLMFEMVDMCSRTMADKVRLVTT